MNRLRSSTTIALLEGSPIKIDWRTKDTLILTSLLEELVNLGGLLFRQSWK